MSITVNVDPCNPGQFFACCGLLELADRLWPGAEGSFAADGRTFRVDECGELAELTSQFANATVRSTLTAEELKRLATYMSVSESKFTAEQLEEKARLKELWRLERLHISQPFDLWLDWWRDERGERLDPKTWAAKQLVAEMVWDMMSAIKAATWATTPDLSNPFPPVLTDSLPFNFDSDFSGQGSARDAGFSTDAAQVRSPFRPFLELFAFCGLQRFRPIQRGDTDMFRYCLWSTPFPVAVACAAATGVLGLNGDSPHQFLLFSRTKYMKSFCPAQPAGPTHLIRFESA